MILLTLILGYEAGCLIWGSDILSNIIWENQKLFTTDKNKEIIDNELNKFEPDCDVFVGGELNFNILSLLVGNLWFIFFIKNMMKFPINKISNLGSNTYKILTIIRK